MLSILAGAAATLLGAGALYRHGPHSENSSNAQTRAEINELARHSAIEHEKLASGIVAVSDKIHESCNISNNFYAEQREWDEKSWKRLDALSNCMLRVDAKVDDLQSDVNALKQTVGKIDKKVDAGFTNVDQRIDNLEKQNADTTAAINALDAKIDALLNAVGKSKPSRNNNP